MNEQLEFLRLIVARLDGAGIPYMLTGSMAMAAYAPPRMTRDLDFVIDCRLSDADRLAALFRKDCYVEETAISEAIKEHRSFNVIHNEWITKADFIVRKESAFHRGEFERRRRVSMGGWDIWVASAEDLLLSKLLWSKGRESEVQRVERPTRGGRAAMNDTPPSVSARYIAELMRQSPARRIEMACDMFGAAKALSMASLRMEWGARGEPELREAFFLRLYSSDLTPEARARAVASLRAA